jgi:Tfp pilus assembly protein PilO
MINKTLLIIIIFFIVLSLELLLFLPKYQNFKSSQLAIKETEQEIKQYQNYFSKIEQASEELKKYSDALSKIDSALPPEPTLIPVYYFLQKNSSQSGLVFKEIGAVKTIALEEKPVIQKHTFPVSFSGSYFALKNFLSVLEKSARLFEIESISFSSPREKEESFIFNLTISLHSY